MNKIHSEWGGKRRNAGRKPSRTELKKMEVYLPPDLKQAAIQQANKLNISQSQYLKSLIEKDLKSEFNS